MKTPTEAALAFMRVGCTVVSSLLVSITDAAAADAPALPPMAQWQTFAGPSGDFTVLSPQPMVKMTTSAGATTGADEYEFKLADDSVHLTAGSTPLPVMYASHGDEAVKLYVEDLMRVSKARVTRQTAGKSDGVPWVMGDATLTNRRTVSFLILRRDKRLYLFDMTVPLGTLAEERRDYLDSVIVGSVKIPSQASAPRPSTKSKPEKPAAAKTASPPATAEEILAGINSPDEITRRATLARAHVGKREQDGNENVSAALLPLARGDGADADVARLALRRWVTVKDVANLTALLGSPAKFNRMPVLTALGELKTTESTKVVASYLSDKTYWLLASSVLGGMGPIAEDAVLPYLADPKPETVRGAVIVLDRVGTAKSLPALNEARAKAVPPNGAMIDSTIRHIERQKTHP